MCLGQIQKIPDFTYLGIMDNLKLLVYQFSAVIVFDEDAPVSNTNVMPQIREQIESHSPKMKLEEDANGEIVKEMLENDSFLASIASTFFLYFRLNTLFATFLGRYFYDHHSNTT